MTIETLTDGPTVTAMLMIPIAVRAFLEGSVTLKKKRIAGKFIDFDTSSKENEAILIQTPSRKLESIPTERVITIVDGWVIADEVSA